MTTIAYRDGVIAADTQETWDDGSFTPCKKIYRISSSDAEIDGHIVALAGGSYSAEVFLEWYENGDWNDPPDLVNLDADEDFEALVVKNDGTLWTCNRLFAFIPIKVDYFAMGSGGKAALGAMAVGATADEAVRAAMKHDCYTGGKVQTLKVTHN